jgi:YHYH protein
VGPGSHRRLQATTIAIAIAAGGCGAAVVAGGAPSASASKKYANTPTSPGPINLRAVPLGDGYVSTTPRVGYVDSCVTQFGSGGGAQVNGPWIDTTNHTWDYRTKLAVNGSVRWPTASYKLANVAGKRKLTFNDLPVDHRTGVFPIVTTDPAYNYDHNPNHIAAQTFSWSLPRNPKRAGKSSCTPLGPIGVLKDGVVLYDALDAQGRDAGAHEVLDRCAGHPDPSNTYHHHDVPPCILNKTQNGRSTLVGFALDGFGIFVTRNRDGVMPTNTQLDACHGTTSKVDWNGRMVRIYHYVATLEYPYTIGCFRGTPISSGHGGGPAGEGPPGGGPPSREAP